MTTDSGRSADASASEKLFRIAKFVGEQEEREAVVAWLKSVGDSKPHGTDWRSYYEAAEAVELGTHRASAIETRRAVTSGAVEDESAVAKPDVQGGAA